MSQTNPEIFKILDGMENVSDDNKALIKKIISFEQQYNVGGAYKGIMKDEICRNIDAMDFSLEEAREEKARIVLW